MLNNKQKEMLSKLVYSEEGELVRDIVKDIVAKLGDISTLDKDPIVSRKIAIDIIKSMLLDYLAEKQERKQSEEETYE